MVAPPTRRPHKETTQLGRNEFTINNAALMHNDSQHCHKVQVRKMCSNTNTRFATRKEHKQTLALGSVECKQVFFQVSTSSNNFLQSYTCAANRSTALSTTDAAAHHNSRGPKRYCARPMSTKLSQTQNKTIPGHSSCVPAVPKLHRRSICSETTCRAVAARGFSSLLVRRSTAASGGSAYSAARLFLVGGPFPRSGS